MTSRRTFLNSCLLALGVRVPKTTTSVFNTMRRGFLVRVPTTDLPLPVVSWVRLPSGGTDGDILTYTDPEYRWVHVEP